MKIRKRHLAATSLVAAFVLVSAATSPANSAPVQSSAPSPSPLQAAAASADALVTSRPDAILASAGETYAQRGAVASNGLTYVPYERTYQGLPVVGGDFVVVTDAAGQVVFTSLAQQNRIGTVDTKATITAAAAERTARKQLTKVTAVESTRLVVSALTGTAKLAWQTTVVGTGAEGHSRLTVTVDAKTGAVLDKLERVVSGTGNGNWEGTVTVATKLSGSTYSLSSPNTTNMPCQNATGNVTFTGSDDVWGNGVGSNRETGCVDALYGAEKEAAMLSAWLGRNGMNGSGGAWPIRVGLNQLNAYYDGTQVQIGKNSAGSWIGATDVIAHEMGHGVDDTTPGGISRSGTQEFVADVFGAATEAYAANPNDPADYLVGEEINLSGSGPIRNMYNPSLKGHPNCYSSSIPSTEVHAAAGPGNHWFYLLAVGSNASGQPVSPTCNNTTVTGIGIQKATKIFYGAMLMKTSSSSYLKYRLWTLTAAKSQYPGSCVEFNAVKAAWNAVSVPAQAGEPTCP
ncbi:M4 family metallopeptidase [Catellatospora sp. KI3]|uniref:M4 family metallopeptidase n=1 Tax=Catellatospora sp. KI3 TaxID=3041620 RepID=UPI0024832903|nr:M4 family metallopeptidase [Catellatospora sp. KI3]MDI1465147.1 M4 family metallopeptidase [Catellatospora sp. KI3]